MGLDLTGIGLAGAIPAVVELAAMPLAGRLAGVILASRVLDGAGYAAQMVGNPIAGLIFDNYGMLTLYALSLGGSLTALVIMLWAGKGKELSQSHHST